MASADHATRHDLLTSALAREEARLATLEREAQEVRSRIDRLRQELPSRYLVSADRDGSKGVAVEDQRSSEHHHQADGDPRDHGGTRN
jgi:hypothetical protein